MQKIDNFDGINPALSVFFMLILVLAMIGIVLVSVGGIADGLFSAPAMAAYADGKLVPEKSFEVIEFTPMTGTSFLVQGPGDLWRC